MMTKTEVKRQNYNSNTKTHHNDVFLASTDWRKKICKKWSRKQYKFLHDRFYLVAKGFVIVVVLLCILLHL